MEWYAGYTIEIVLDKPETQEHMRRDSSIILANHASDIDWLLGWVVTHKFGTLGVRHRGMRGEGEPD